MSSGKLKLIFGTHNHQPYGNDTYFFESAYQNAYKPFLSVLYNHPRIKAVLHYSGVLLQWIEEAHPEFIMLLKEMVKRKQVELLGGGFYEPVLPVIPNSDKLGQIESLTTFLRKRFGRRPHGNWIAERVWNPNLPTTIKNSGMDYTFLDDQHFYLGGLSGKDLFEPCITENTGKAITVFPMKKELRYMVPFYPVEEVIDYLHARAAEGENRICVILGDGEKFGNWEGTHSLCYEKGWLDEFLTRLEESSSVIETDIPRNFERNLGKLKKCYFPASAYQELMEWSMTPEQRERYNHASERIDNIPALYFISGGIFRNFFAKYTESNQLYAKMVSTSILVKQIRGDKYRKKAATEELWKGQCNNAYWHGQFGGIYINRLRKAAYQALIEAEKITREQGVFIPCIITADFDTDGLLEYMYQGNEINAYVHLYGGIMFELDYLPASWNYLDTFSRYRENYHSQTAYQNGFDWYQRKAFIDHFFNADINIDSFKRMKYKELGNFINTRYNVEEFNRNHNEIILSKEGIISQNEREVSIKIIKRYVFHKNSIDVYYTLHNTSDTQLETYFASEMNYSFASNKMESMRLFIVRDKKEQEIPRDCHETDQCRELMMEDRLNEAHVQIEFSETTKRFWSLPVETLSQTITGIEPIYQSTCLVPIWHINLEADDAWETHIHVSIDGIE